jgi:hypothetical protein
MQVVERRVHKLLHPVVKAAIDFAATPNGLSNLRLVPTN